MKQFYPNLFAHSALMGNARLRLYESSGQADHQNANVYTVRDCTNVVNCAYFFRIYIPNNRIERDCCLPCIGEDQLNSRPLSQLPVTEQLAVFAAQNFKPALDFSLFRSCSVVGTTLSIERLIRG